MELSKLKSTIAFQWKIQGFTKDKSKAICVAYIDSRDAQSLLDEVCWPENWSSEFYEVKGKLFCRVGIYVNSQWVYKSDSGALEGSDDVDSETTSKWESSDAFKRACVQWGIWRFLYDMDIQWVEASIYQANKYKLTEYINWLKGNTQWNNATIRDDVPQVPTYSPKGKQLAEYIAEIKQEKDSNVIRTLQDEAKQGKLSEKQIGWLDKEVMTRLDIIKNLPF